MRVTIETTQIGEQVPEQTKSQECNHGAIIVPSGASHIWGNLVEVRDSLRKALNMAETLLLRAETKHAVKEALLELSEAERVDGIRRAVTNGGKIARA